MREVRIPIGTRVLGALVLLAIVAVLIAVRCFVGGSYVAGGVALVVVAWAVWRIRWCGVVVTSTTLELRGVLRTHRLARPCLGTATSTPSGALVVSPVRGRRVVIRSFGGLGVSHRRHDAALVDALELAGLDASGVR